jgi:hypothetical protein
MTETMEHKLLSEAHERATTALSEVKTLTNVIQAHEDLNLERYSNLKNSDKERYDNILKELESIKEGQSKTNNRMWLAAGSIILLLLAMLGYMVTLGIDQVMAGVIHNTATEIAIYKGEV